MTYDTMIVNTPYWFEAHLKYQSYQFDIALFEMGTSISESYIKMPNYPFSAENTKYNYESQL